MDKAVVIQGAGQQPAPTVLPAKWDGRLTFTVDEFGEIFRISRAGAYAAVANGTVGSIRIGRRVLIPRPVIERMLTAA
jgi:hypothetical protein